MLSSSLTPCTLRLTRDIWKSSKVWICETGGGIGGTRTNPLIWGAWTRSKCKRTFGTGFVTHYKGGGGGWLTVAWAAATSTTSCVAAKRVALDPTITEKCESQKSRNLKD